jgi:hypothetical protein
MIARQSVISNDFACLGLRFPPFGNVISPDKRYEIAPPKARQLE